MDEAVIKRIHIGASLPPDVIETIFGAAATGHTVVVEDMHAAMEHADRHAGAVLIVDGAMKMLHQRMLDTAHAPIVVVEDHRHGPDFHTRVDEFMLAVERDGSGLLAKPSHALLWSSEDADRALTWEAKHMDIKIAPVLDCGTGDGPRNRAERRAVARRDRKRQRARRF